MIDYRLLILPVIGGIIGWFTNYLAVKMLFRPRRPVCLLGFRVQGLVPRRRAELAASIGETVERELVSHADIEQVLSDAAFIEGLRPRLAESVDRFLHDRLVRDNPLLRAVMATQSALKLKDWIVEEIMQSLPSIVEGFADELKERLHFRELVVSKIEAFELERLENLVTSVAGKELRAILVLGGVIGFLIGVAQMIVITLLPNA